MDWVFAKLDEGFNFNKDDVVSRARKDCSWSQMGEEANILREKHVKFGIICQAMSLCKLDKSKDKDNGPSEKSPAEIENFRKRHKGNMRPIPGK
jgi:hypothetical protein